MTHIMLVLANLALCAGNLTGSHWWSLVVGAFNAFVAGFVLACYMWEVRRDSAAA